MVVFWLGLTTFVTGFLVRRFESCWFDDVCNVGCPLVAWPGPAAVHGHRSQTLSARWPDCLKPSSPLLAGICVGLKPPSPLRVRNRCFLARFSGAEVMVVSMVAVQGRAVVLSVSKSPRCRASCAKKFALHAQNTLKSAFLRLLGELFRGNAVGGAVLGELFRGNAAEGAVLGEFFRANQPGAQVL